MSEDKEQNERQVAGMTEERLREFVRRVVREELDKHDKQQVQSLRRLGWPIGLEVK